ncbi:hypothetical protein RYX36_018578, partial [Vicia faba]
MVLILEEDSCLVEGKDKEEEAETVSNEWRDMEVEGSQSTPTPSPKSTSAKKLVYPMQCLSLKRPEEPNDEFEHLQQPENYPYLDIETTYI